MSNGTQTQQWGNPGALGLFGFGFNTILLQIHNLGAIQSDVPIIFGFVWGGLAQVIAGIIDGKRGDTFGLTAFTSYGIFWIGLALYLTLNTTHVLGGADAHGLAYAFVMWGVFTGLMTIGTLKISWAHVFIFASLTILFFLLAAHFFTSKCSAKIAGVEGLFCGASAVYTGAAVVINEKFGKTVLPIFPIAKKT